MNEESNIQNNEYSSEQIDSSKVSKDRYILFLILFFVITFVWSWTLWIPELLFPDSKYVFFSTTAAIFGPSISGIIIIGIQNGGSGIKNLFKKGIKVKFQWIWYLIVFLLGPIYAGITFLISKYGLQLEIESEMLQNPLMILIAFFYIFFLQGPLGEEFGWRGYALEKLQANLNSYWSSLILGFIWSLWHLPLFFMPNAIQSQIPIWQFILYTVTITFLYTWIYNFTGKSVFATLFFHLMMNLSLGIFPYFQTLLSGIIGYSILAIFTLVILLSFRKKTENQIKTSQ